MRIRLYYAATLDGFIADAGGAVSWLDAYNGRRYGYDAFMREIGLIVAGRTTYDQALGFGSDAFGDKDVLVMSVQGASVEEGARALIIEDGTVRNHRAIASQKLNAHNRVEAARIAEEKGWL